MNVKVLTEPEYHIYEEFLLSNEYSLLYHSVKYKLMLEALLQCESRYLLACDNNKIVAALPLMLKHGSLGTIINSIPYYGSNGGIIGEVNSDIIGLFKRQINMLDFSAITLVSSPFIDSIGMLLEPATDQRYSMITHLNTTEDPQEYLMSIIEASTRRNIKKAIREGITISEENSAMQFLEETHNENMLVINGKPKTGQFFSELSKHFVQGKDYKIMLAKRDGEPIAGLLVFYYNKTIEYFTPVIKHEFRDKQPLALIIYKTMIDAINQGYSYWNWGGTWLSQTGVYQFKKKWGASERLYNYATRVINESIYNAERHVLDDEYQGFYVYNFNKASNE